MKIAKFVSYLESLGIRLWLDKNQLRYQAPKEALTAALRAEIIDHKAEIMSFLSQANQVLSSPIEPVGREDKAQFPLSFAQQRLWFLAQLEGASEAYNIQVPLRLDGPLDVALFNQAWQQLEERHETLRTTFPMVDGQPRQQINPPSFKLETHDLSDLPTSEQEAEVARLSHQEGRHCFDLVNGPLWRVTLLRLSEKTHVLLLTMHHIISDGWSIGVLMRDFSALIVGRILPELSVQYADFAVWEREWFSGEPLEQQLGYWKAQLANAPALLSLPTDHPRPAQQSYRGANLSFRLPKTLLPKLVSLSSENNTTLFMTLQAAFAVLLSRYSGTDDILIGTPIANRQVPEVENLIGFFTNTLVLRNDLSGNPSFRDFLAIVRQVTLDAYQRQALPFELLVEALKPSRSLSHSPLFQVIFTLNNKAQGADLFSHLTVNPLEVEYSIAKFDLTLTMQEHEEGLSGSWEYNTDLFSHATIERMSGHWKTLLEGIVANPNLAIADLPLLSEAEKHQLLVEWNDTAADYPSDKCIHQLFEQQVARTAEAIALVFDDQNITYHELNRRANQLAHYLIAQGVGVDVLVGICVERSIEMIVGLLGILKAGGAYLPLDPSVPGERLAFMLEDAQVPILLTQQQFIEGLSEQAVYLGSSVGQVFSLDSDWPTIATESISNPPKQANVRSTGPDSLAYVIYTSGSTGRPKGVMVPHRGINRLVNKTNYIEIRASDRMAQASNASFDAATFEIWGALLHGACLVGIPHEVAIEPSSLASFLSQQEISILFLTTALFNQVVSFAPQAFSNLRHLLFGGEAVDPVSVRTLLDYGAPEHFLHVYGPTENTTYSSWYPIKSVAENALTVPIGRAIANSQIYILDGQHQPVPIGVPGELYLAGSGLALGYLNRPQLTREKFIPNPFGPGRLYKTGDLCRYLPDGNIEFLGRTDYQVKIRGFRIELGEIEAVLNSFRDVREAVVVVRDEPDKRLVAYVVGEAPSRALLTEKLPDYMIPTAFVSLEAMPLTPNGKIDRRALPALGDVRQAAQLVLPRTPQEAILAAIWQEVLGVQVGIHDNFFSIGGHSLLATQMVSRIRQIAQVELPLRRLWIAPTIAELAPFLSSPEKILPPIEKVARLEPNEQFPLSFAQQRLWFLAQLEGSREAYNIPVALRLDGPLDVALFNQTWQQLEERHETLRTTFPIVDGQPRQQINPPGFNLEVIDLSELPTSEQKAEVARLSRQEGTHPFDLVNGPLWRVTLLRLGPSQHVLLLTMHHIISDGWSISVLMRDFSALVAGHRLPELSVQYADFAVWEREWLTGDVLAEQLDYFKAQLASAPPLLSLPTDHPRPAAQSYRGEHFSFTLPKALQDELVSLSGESNTTLFMTLQAAFAVLLWRVSGTDDILIGTPIANRQVAELENLIGFFANTLVLRNDLSGNPSFSDFLARVRQVALDAYQRQALPFELLVETLKPARSLSHSPLFQVMFTLHNKGQGADLFSHLTVNPLEVEYPIAKFSLTLTMQQHEEGLIGSWEYNTDIFERATIERMSGHFQTLLEGIVANPNLPIADLPLLTKAEKDQLLVEWNDTAADYPSDKCIHQLFEQQVTRTPDAVAVVFNDSPKSTLAQQLTYHELNARANQLAHYLIAQGVGADVLVAICVERSIEMVVGLLGILKAGGAYVPLDPAIPSERRRFMLSDSGGQVLLTSGQLVDALRPSFLDVDSQEKAVLCLDQDWELIEQEDDSNPQTIVKPNHLAYCIYTSGSTGQPKGVLVEHRNLVNFVQSVLVEYDFSQQDRVLQFSSISFDAAGEEIYPILLTGGTLVLRSNEMLSVPAFWKNGQDFKLTVLGLPTAYWHQLASELTTMIKSPLPKGVRLVIIGGERAVPERLKIWQQHVGQPPKLLNTYGPTEGTIVTTSYDLSDHQVILGRELPIGRPLSNIQVYILNQFLQLVPIGVAGELHIGGAGVARGYLNRPQLTREKFIPNPFGPGRLYKTGDLCRYLPDGNIEFLGRTDYQVKIRGFRIELGEIEANLRQCLGVREAVVVVVDSELGKQLVAYVVGELPNRAFLTEKLPDYMIPSAFVSLEAMPLSPNGKIDRRALPAPTRLSQTTYVAPQNEIERQLVAVWQKVLKVDKVGIDDNFFELGGHSLLIVQLHNRLQEMYEQTLAITDFFRYPTVNALAAHLSKSVGTRTDSPPESTGEQDRALVRRTRRTNRRQQKELRQKSRRR